MNEQTLNHEIINKAGFLRSLGSPSSASWRKKGLGVEVNQNAFNFYLKKYS